MVFEQSVLPAECLVAEAAISDNPLSESGAVLGAAARLLNRHDGYRDKWYVV
jgi:hypothetical protein